MRPLWLVYNICCLTYTTGRYGTSKHPDSFTILGEMRALRRIFHAIKGQCDIKMKKIDDYIMSGTDANLSTAEFLELWNDINNLDEQWRHMEAAWDKHIGDRSEEGTDPDPGEHLKQLMLDACIRINKNLVMS